MNKNTFIGTLLMCLILFGYMWYMQPTPEQIEAQRRYQDSLMKAQAEVVADQAAQAELSALTADSALTVQDSAQIALLDSLNQVKLVQTYGNLAGAVEGTEQNVVIENEVIRLTLSTKGGQIKQALLKKYDDYQGDTLEVFNAESNDLYYTLATPKGNFNTDRFYFEPINATATGVTMRLKSSDGAVLDFIYELPEADSYLVHYSLHTQNVDRILNDRSVTMNWFQSLPRTELGRDFEGRYSQLYYKYSGNSSDNLSSAGNDDEVIDNRLAWFSFQNQFFSTMFVTNDLFYLILSIAPGAMLNMSSAISTGFNMSNATKIEYTANTDSVSINPVTGQLMVKGNAKGTVTVSIKITLRNGKTKTIKTKLKIS